jgi:hypothetical protein
MSLTNKGKARVSRDTKDADSKGNNNKSKEELAGTSNNNRETKTTTSSPALTHSSSLTL